MSQLPHFELHTTFSDGSVTHMTHSPNVSTVTKWTNQIVLGSGGFGIVTLQEAEGQLRAVKRIQKGLGKTYRSRELAVLAKVNHRNDLFVEFLGWYQNTDFIFIVMEFIKDGDLSHYLKSYAPSVAGNVRAITRQLLQGLAILHSLNITHRDIKPQNILIASLEPIWVKIADFGVSKCTTGTALRTRIASQGYAAPELLGLLPGTSNTYCNAVDMWALGCVVHEMLTTEIPFMEVNDSLTTTWGLMLDTGSENGPLVQTDMQLLSDFCRGTDKFPCGSLILSGADETAIQFLESILIPNPKSRLSANEALHSTWLLHGDDIDRVDPKSRLSANEALDSTWLLDGDDIEMLDCNQLGSLLVRQAASEPITALNPQGPPLPMFSQTRPSFAEEEIFSCPFWASSHPAKVRSCGAGFRNLSKVKYVRIFILRVVTKYLDMPVMIFGSRDHLRGLHFPHLQCPQCSFRAGARFEIDQHQRKKHQSAYLPPTQKTIDLDHILKHKALKRGALKWDEISRICFSSDYAQVVVTEMSNEERTQSQIFLF